MKVWQLVFCDFDTDSFINSVTLSIRDEDCMLFDLKGLLLGFEIELKIFYTYTMLPAILLPSALPKEARRDHLARRP